MRPAVQHLLSKGPLPSSKAGVQKISEWQEAFEANKAPRVVLRATHQGALAHCSLADFKRFAVDLA